MDTVQAPILGTIQPDMFDGLSPELPMVTMRGYCVEMCEKGRDIGERWEDFLIIAEDEEMAGQLATELAPPSITDISEAYQVQHITREMVDTYNQWLSQKVKSMFEPRMAA